jgi:valyl-tRNA synthetase
MIAPYPSSDKEAIDPEAEQEMGLVFEIVRAIRNARAEAKVEAAKWIEAIIAAGDAKLALEPLAPLIAALARTEPLTILGRGEEKARPDKAKILVLGGMEVILPWVSMIDLGKERQRLEKEIEVTQARITRFEEKLRDEAFLAKAPGRIVEGEREKLRRDQVKLAKLKERLTELS